MLKPKTRGVNLPQGKPRVYFAAHPLDREAYFEELAGDILAAVNCAVWYNDSADEQTSLDDLREMKLFVVPVTTRLFESANDARDREVPFALANNIPLLPILCERGAADRFNKTFGTKHCLDRVSDDPNALPYETKLEEFLKSALLRDRQLDEILAAFSARLFLSYRKKDRDQARELMRLIHKNDSCVDLGIWYDEYLTPGEDFNDEIRRAIEECDVLTVAVTPNIVNEDNYVREQELPWARERNKPILAAEMVSTDRGAFDEADKDVRDGLVDGRSDALIDALRQKIREASVADKPKDGRHDFCIGLAYLYGIHVEADPVRAVEMIQRAAMRGETDAMKKLADVYGKGLGVPKDLILAHGWLERRMFCLSTVLDGGYSNGEILAFLTALLDFCNSAIDLEYYDAAEKILRPTVKYVRELVKHTDCEELTYLWASMLVALGESLLEKGIAEGVRELLSTAYHLFEKLNGATNISYAMVTGRDRRQVRYCLGLVRSAMLLSRAFLADGWTEDAREWCEDARSVLLLNDAVLAEESTHFFAVGQVYATLYRLLAPTPDHPEDREQREDCVAVVRECIDTLRAGRQEELADTLEKEYRSITEDAPRA